MPSPMLKAAQSIDIGGEALPLLGTSNLWVETSLLDRSSTFLTQLIMQQALEQTFPGQLRVIVYDGAISGLAAPFQGLNAGGEHLLDIINDERDLDDTLHRLRDTVQSVENVIQGRQPTLPAFRAAIDYPVEEYLLVVISTDVSALEPRTQQLLGLLMKAGPSAGVCFVIHSTTLKVNEQFFDSCCKLETQSWNGAQGQSIGTFGSGVPGFAGRQCACLWTASQAEDLIQTAHDIAGALATVKLDTVPFDSIQDLDDTWSESSADGITFSVGRYGLETMEVTLGDELNQRHNVLVTGAVGQGKSNLISVVIHSLCQRYAPWELELYLLDFKEGVTLQPFFDERAGEYLPHARVLGLEADREFGLSVLRHLFGVYKSRMRLFKAAGVQNIKQYREGHPGARMPRILLAVDEFQLMFSERDRISDEIADLLVKGVRLFRASGIHVLLASQTIGGNVALMGSAGEGLFGQVPVRVALKNSLAESHATLGSRNDAAAYLRSREAIVNLDYGERSANRRTSIAFADEGLLGPIRHCWWLAARDRTDPPFVFNGTQERALSDDRQSVAELAERYALTAIAGQRIEVGAGPLELGFESDAGRNAALVGTGSVVGELMSIATALASQRNPDVPRFVFLDALAHDEQWERGKTAYVERLRSLGAEVAIVDRDGINGVLDDIARSRGLAADAAEQSDADVGAAGASVENEADSELAAMVKEYGISMEEFAGNTGGAGMPSPLSPGNSRETFADDGRKIFIIGLGIERCRKLTPSFAMLAEFGSSAGVHLLIWWKRYDSFKNQVGYQGEENFDIKMAFHLDPQSAKQFMNDPLLAWRSDDNRILVWDAAEMTDPVKVIPYVDVEHGRA